ncbi:hypothetical protein GCM10011375_40200 [Hymenobacter qilianensis]|uniref:Uncharacterized protein n=1 Tax=Hymenobacter qilianensis TaxID=1385715 RepID=A0ACB5PXH7_9BACT|nr:hypothetical protein GCM10011375_40200 [Hymenobacter qilianensis]
MSDWTLIYITDSTGTAVVGSVADLTRAVRAGADVKVIYNSGPGVWWSRYCESVSTRGTGSARLVSATYMRAADTRVGGTGLEFEVPFAVEYHIYNSNGVYWMSKAGNSTYRTVPMRWYVKDYKLPSIFDQIRDIRDRVFRRRTEDR